MRRWRVRAAEAGRRREQRECDREDGSSRHRHRRATGTLLTLTGGFEVRRRGDDRAEEWGEGDQVGGRREGGREEGGPVHRVV